MSRRTVALALAALAAAGGTFAPSASAATSNTWATTVSGAQGSTTVYGVGTATGVVHGAGQDVVLSCDAVSPQRVTVQVGCYLWGNSEGKAYYGTVRTTGTLAHWEGTVHLSAAQTYLLCVHVNIGTGSTWLRSSCSASVSV
ncbi:MAG TPA: hypothetical protein VFQ85_05725 [Mycobacteriales bacterium]|jgi:hypothetical protein|nr:hypothetical protein [Mycobacteriales bacterium]